MKFNIKYVIVILFLMLLSILYNRYKKKYQADDELSQFPLVKKYLLNEDNKLSGKPILWVHTKYSVNSRQWKDFKSRNTKNLNQKYLELCVEGIVKFCSKSFNVCLINDDSFSNLIPNWNIEMNRLSEPKLSHIRDLGLAKILYNYGGMLLPNSVIMLKDVIELWQEKTSNKSMFVCEMVARNVISEKTRFYPSRKLMGCKKKSKSMLEYINELEWLISNDNSNMVDFSGKFDGILYNMVLEGKCGLIDGKKFGTKTKDDEPILIDDLMNATYKPLEVELYGLYIPNDELLSRTKYNWFVRLNRHEIYNANTLASKYFVISHGR